MATIQEKWKEMLAIVTGAGGALTLIQKFRGQAEATKTEASNLIASVKSEASGQIQTLLGEKEKLQLEVSGLKTELSSQGSKLQQDLNLSNTTIQDQKKQIDEAIAARNAAERIASMAQNQPQRECIKCHQLYPEALGACPMCGSLPYVK